MKQLFVLLVLLTSVGLCSSAQTLYVPGGTGGITNNTTNTNFGIGAAIPQYKFDVAGNIVNTKPSMGFLGLTGDLPGYSTDTYPTLKTNYTNLYFSSGGKYSGYMGGSDAVFGLLNTATAEKVRLHTNGYSFFNGGNVGIGTSTPQFKLEVVAGNQVAVGNTYIDNSLYPANNYVRSNFGSNVYWDATNNVWRVLTIGANDFSSMIHPNGGGFAFITAPSDGNTPKSLNNSQFSSYERMRISPTGDVGIGTSPYFRFHVRGGTPNSEMMSLGTSNTGNFAVTSADGGAYGLFAGVGSTGRAWLQVGRYDSNVAYDLMLQSAGGNVGIGTTSTDAKLTVKGDIHTREVRVDVTGGVGPDYVFEKDYNLLPLSEVETYIKQNKHLPEVPSAKEMENDGLNLKEMNLLLLKKVEELTLHVIDLNKKMQMQQKEHEEQTGKMLAEINGMKKQLNSKDK